MNLQEEIKIMKEGIAELEEQDKEEREFPQYAEEYWYVDSDTEVMGTVWYGDEFDSDQGRLSIDNVFKTKEEAEFVAEKLEIEAELRKYSVPFKPWSNNHVVTFTSQGELEIKNVALTNHQGAIHFESGEKAQQAVNSIGEDYIKKYLFRVWD